LRAADALRLVTDKVKKRKYDLLKLSRGERADYDGSSRENIVVAPRLYKARPLVGIWASPPFLHNGSVPTLYDLLSTERPSKFYIGNREYDPVKVGFVTARYPGGQEFDTAVPGNSNLGHWFANDGRPGTIGSELEEAERWDVIEYLKAATYKIYPCTDAETGERLTGPSCGMEDGQLPE
jgi:hypothetical protein